VRFASKGASHAAVSAGHIRWLIPFSKENKIDVVVFEAPVRKPQYKSSHDANDVTTGLIWSSQGILYERGVYKQFFAPVNSIRKFFLGTASMPREEAKHRTVMRCRALCWDPADDNAADALAMWAYQCSLIDPTQGTSLSPLFNKRRAIA
jgi:hypothetical protein